MDKLMAEITNIRQSLAILTDKSSKEIIVKSLNEPADLASYLNNYDVRAVIPPYYPEYLGAKSFLSTHLCRFPYIVGEMANGIASADMVIAAAKGGLVGSFGAAGLTPDVIEKNLVKIKENLLPDFNNWGANLIHSPNEPTIESKTVDLFLQHEVRRVSASAYMNLSSHIVHYAMKGLKTLPNGDIARENYVIAKISRPELAEKFMSPAPQEILQQLVSEGKLTSEEANLAQHIAVAEDITCEADSGGHTDNRALTALFPVINLLAKRQQEKYNFKQAFRIGAAGGIGTPTATAAAFAMGAAYVLTGSVNESCVEAGISDSAREMLAKAEMADVAMAPAADMFEIGVKLQVLKKGTLFAQRASKLYDAYIAYDSLEDIPEEIKATLEKTIFKRPLQEVWQITKDYFETRDITQVEHAERDPKYKMALTFRWYLGLSSAWAITDDADRRFDYQIWCGPSMGSFNDWAEGSFLEGIDQRDTVQVAQNLMEGAAVILRIQQLRQLGIEVTSSEFFFAPQKFE